MAVYLFTFHAYRSWMPDRKKGYVKRGQGVLPTDPKMAQRYTTNATQDEILFDETIQRALVAAARAVCKDNRYRLHQVMTEVTHVHTLLSWRGFMQWREVRRKLRYRMTSELNIVFEQRKWFSAVGSRKRVRDREHFDYLMDEYLPKHKGEYWREGGERR